MLEQLESKLGYTFRNKELLHHAMIHTSYANEKKLGHQASYEQLEFLGDAVLQLVSSDYLTKVHPEYNEGQLSRARASLVSTEPMSQRARELGLGQYILLGKGEQKNGGANNDRILCNVMESVIGAIYRDSGFKSAEYFINRFILNHGEIADKDYKTQLQEYLGERADNLEYRLIEESGADHEKIYTIQVYLEHKPLGIGKGTNKKKAEQEGAKQTLSKLTS